MMSWPSLGSLSCMSSPCSVTRESARPRVCTLRTRQGLHAEESREGSTYRNRPETSRHNEGLCSPAFPSSFSPKVLHSPCSISFLFFHTRLDSDSLPYISLFAEGERAFWKRLTATVSSSLLRLPTREVLPGRFHSYRGR